MRSAALPGRRLAILGALAGAFASAYLLVDYLGGSTICLTGSGCEEVRASAFAYPLGIPLPAPGLAFYLVALAGLLLSPTRRIGGTSSSTLLVAWSCLGVLVMAGLTMIEAFVIGAACGWCLVAAAASLGLAIGTIGWARGLRRSATGANGGPGPRSRRARRLEARLQEEERGVARFAAISGGLLAALLVALLALPGLSAGQPSASVLPTGGDLDRPRLGSGPVAVTVFSDFACPACARVAPWLEQLAGEGSATVTYRYFPLTEIHPNALAAARAAQAAHRQGQFWAYHDRLFGTQASWAEARADQAATMFEEVAAGLGLDVARWRDDLAGAAGPVAEDLAEAQRLALRGTPSIFINGRAYQGRLTLDDLRAAVRSAS